jgi:hypothetical protein
MEMIRIVFIGLMIVFLQGCTGGKTPPKEEIVGTWISADSATLEFKADGSFIGKNLPSTIVSDPSRKIFDSSGKWSIEAIRKSWDQQPWYISLSFAYKPTRYISATSLIVSGSNLDENSPPWVSLFFWVDEEGGARYEFKKK